MRPRNFLSAVVIYGTISGIGGLTIFWIMGAATKVPWRFTPIEDLMIVVLFGVPMGLFLGFWIGPTTRTLNYVFSDEFRIRLEAALGSMHYQRHAESPTQLAYRTSPPYGGLLPITPDITIDKDTSPVRVSGPRNMLGQLEKKLRQTGVGTGSIAHNISG
jgi:hypothetical protein